MSGWSVVRYLWKGLRSGYQEGAAFRIVDTRTLAFVQAGPNEFIWFRRCGSRPKRNTGAWHR
jgi:hypothetical protein